MATWADLLEACRAGDAAAWSEIVARLSGPARHAARRAGIPEAALDDAVQDVFVILYRQLPGIRDAEALPAWAVTTARRQARRHGRPGGTGSAEFGEELDTPDEPLVRWEELSRVRVALEALGGRCADLLTELYRSGSRPDYRMLADRLDIPVGSIGPTRARCLAKLLELMERTAVPDPVVSGERERTPLHGEDLD